MSHHYPRSLLFRRIFILASCILTISGCSYGNYFIRKAHWRQTFQYLPSVSALNQLAPEDSLVLNGHIIRLQKRQDPLLLVVVSNRYRENETVALVQLQKTSVDAYMAFLPRGDYELFVFADIDGNGDFESNEMIGRTKATIGPENSKGGIVVEGPSITVDFDHPGTVDFHLSETVRPSGYVYKSLDDEFFDPKYGNMGVYNPSNLIAHNQGFVFGLEDFNDKKTMVLFVHGISGTPRDWKYIAAGLDRSRFQPFFFYYPSGLPLDKLGTMLAQLIETIDKTSNGGSGIVLVAHSMGGLVSLSAINKLSEEAFPASLKLYCSFSTPYGGDEAAKKWIDNAPVVVPSWRDIGAPSAFLTDLTSRPFPKKLPFYLYFSFNDVSVSLRSQLISPAQTIATRIIGVDETHVGILNSETTRDSFLRLLDTVSPPRRADVKSP